jgi:uncharacterized membrane protein YecN with MAPEG domain
MITSLYTALLALILIFLSIKIIQNRRSSKISLGENGDDFLQRKIRAHGNFIEYTPIFLIMLLFCDPWIGSNVCLFGRCRVVYGTRRSARCTFSELQCALQVAASTIHLSCVSLVHFLCF